MQKSKHPLQLEPSKTIREKFMSTVKAEYATCQAAGTNLLILFFGHGEMHSKGIWLGNRILESSTVARLLQRNKKHKGPKMRATIMSLACFSGAWSTDGVLSPLSSTVMSAGPNVVSRSRPMSTSVRGRAGGSMYASAIIGQLSKSGITKKDVFDNDDEYTSEQNETYAAWTRAVFESWTGQDRLAYNHEFKFSAQDDGWGDTFEARTGIARDADYQKRWKGLTDYPISQTLHPGDGMNRNPDVTEVVRAQFQDFKQRFKSRGITVADASDLEAVACQSLKHKASSLRGGTPHDRTGIMIHAARGYLDCVTFEDDNTASDGFQHDL